MIRKKIAVFASGRGSNALNIITYFETHPAIRVSLLISNKADAPVVRAAAEKGVETLVVPNARIEEPGFLRGICEQKAIDGIVLAGFLRKIPRDLVSRYENRIVNIHPSLLPKYGGAGMYGDFVHQAVLAARETESGISIHLVDAEYDRGRIIAQFSCKLDREECLESIREKIHLLEMQHFPKVIESVFGSAGKNQF